MLSSCKAEGVRLESSEPVWPIRGLPINLANIKLSFHVIGYCKGQNSWQETQVTQMHIP